MIKIDEDPQRTTYTIAIDNAQLEHIMLGLKLLAVSGIVDDVYDTSDVSYVSPEQTLELLQEIADDQEHDRTTTYGLCL